ncbi:MAG TPA: serine/threonine-protein kinase, partial [Gemmatimonadaceae bacterium]|nr:serine/threonine-protein kinase [Gemmatimonadaceae bacterium]
ACGNDLTDGGTTRPMSDPVDELRARLVRTFDGRYNVRELLGAGGMGAVFLADDLQLEREVAIKVLPLSLASDPQVVQRFQREAKTAAKLDHPHIIPIYRVESENGLEYFVMKYVRGRSLESILEQGGPMPVPEAVRILREAATALGHAHQRGVVHRDVKPANIMLEGDGRVILTDFGISKAADAASTQLTSTGMIVGTPNYIAPEQALGKAVDGRADQYALGVTAFQMLTGQLLFTGESAQAILVRHVVDAPPRVSSVRPDVPRHVDAAVARTLAKTPEERFATMEQLAAALEGKPVAAAASAPTLVSAPRAAVSSAAATVPLAAAAVPAARRRSVGRWAALIGVVAVGAVAAARYGVPAKRDAALPVATPVPDSIATAAAGSTVDAPASAPVDSTATSGASDSTPAPDGPRPLRRVVAARQAQRSLARTAPLTVGAEPYGTLYVDGVEIGDTPVVNHPLPVGRHEIRVEREGYRTRRETIVVAEPNPIRRRYILEAREP